MEWWNSWTSVPIKGRPAPAHGVNMSRQRLSKWVIHSATDQPMWPKPSATSPPALEKSVWSITRAVGCARPYLVPTIRSKKDCIRKFPPSAFSMDFRTSSSTMPLIPPLKTGYSLAPCCSKSEGVSPYPSKDKARTPEDLGLMCICAGNCASKQHASPPIGHSVIPTIDVVESNFPNAVTHSVHSKWPHGRGYCPVASKQQKQALWLVRGPACLHLSGGSR